MYFISILLNKYLNKIFFVLFYLSFFFKFNSYLFFLIRLAIRLRFYENIDNLYLRIDKKKILNQKQIDTEIVLYSLNKINNKFQITYDNLSLNSKFFFNHLDCIKKLKTSKEIVNYIYKNKSNFDNKFKLFLFNLIHDYFSLDCFCDDLYNLIIFYQSLSFKEKKLFKAYKSNNLYKSFY